MKRPVSGGSGLCTGLGLRGCVRSTLQAVDWPRSINHACCPDPRHVWVYYVLGVHSTQSGCTMYCVLCTQQATCRLCASTTSWSWVKCSTNGGWLGCVSGLGPLRCVWLVPRQNVPAALEVLRTIVGPSLQECTCNKLAIPSTSRAMPLQVCTAPCWLWASVAGRRQAADMFCVCSCCAHAGMQQVDTD